MDKFNDKEYWDFLDEWKKARNYEPFCEDGLLSVEKWDNSAHIMFLLKESYDDFYEIHDNGPYGPHGGSTMFWPHMRMETYIIEELVKGRMPEYDKAFTIKNEPNDSVAYVNIKKLVEHNKTSDDKVIADYAKKDKEFLLRQINLIAPKIIICSGTYKFSQSIFDDITPISKNLSRINNILLMDYWHLSYPVGDKEVFDDFTRILGAYFKT
jgi:hypothetical protein